MTDSKLPNKPLTFVEVLGSVFAGAFGVQTQANRQRDFSRGNVAQFVLAGILFTAAFVVLLVGVVSWVVG